MGAQPEMHSRDRGGPDSPKVADTGRTKCRQCRGGGGRMLTAPARLAFLNQVYVDVVTRCDQTIASIRDLGRSLLVHPWIVLVTELRCILHPDYYLLIPKSLQHGLVLLLAPRSSQPQLRNTHQYTRSIHILRTKEVSWSSPQTRSA